MNLRCRWRKGREEGSLSTADLNFVRITAPRITTIFHDRTSDTVSLSTILSHDLFLFTMRRCPKFCDAVANSLTEAVWRHTFRSIEIYGKRIQRPTLQVNFIILLNKYKHRFKHIYPNEISKQQKIIGLTMT